MPLSPGTRLGREGAEERMARFEREAQVLASLNHPNIAALEAEGPPSITVVMNRAPKN